MTEDDALRRQANLLSLEGVPTSEVAQRLGVSVADVESWFADAWSEWEQKMASLSLDGSSLPELDSVATDAVRREDAARLLDTQQFLYVEVSPDPDWPADAGDFTVTFDDLASHTFSDLVDESVTWLTNQPEVREAVREDREMICVWGDLSGDRLAVELALWWRERLRRFAEIE